MADYFPFRLLKSYRFPGEYSCETAKIKSEKKLSALAASNQLSV